MNLTASNVPADELAPAPGHGSVHVMLVALILLVANGAMPTPSQAQHSRDPLARRAVYFELMGPGGLYSLNGDASVGSGVFTVRGGATSWATNVDLDRIGMRGIFGGAGRHWDMSETFRQGPGRLLETSAVVFGGSFEDSRGDEPPRSGTLLMLVPSAGLRYQPPDRGWMLRAVITSYLPLTGEMPVGNRDKPAIGAGLSAGYAW